MKNLLIISVLTFIAASCNTQGKTELEQFAVGFEDLISDSFSFLDNELEGVRIVGYGEDTHGTSQFTLLTEVLIDYLSKQHNFNVLIIETGFGEGAFLNDYIQGRRDDLATILNDHNSTWRYDTQEFYQLMNWLKVYNQNHTKKIHLYGCEMQYVISDVNRIQDYLNSVSSNYIIEGFEKHLWQNIDENEKSDYSTSYNNLKKYFTDNQEIFISRSSKESYNLVSHHIEVLGQLATTITHNAEQRKNELRDFYMAENIEWILSANGSESKALYWAHNAHVGDWINNGNVEVTGLHLRKKYGQSYYNIATDFGTGSFIAFPHDANQTNNWKLGTIKHDEVVKNTLSHRLMAMGKPNAYLNLRKARLNPALKLELQKNLTTMSGGGAQARPSKTETNDIGKAFDGIIYLDKTNPIHKN